MSSITLMPEPEAVKLLAQYKIKYPDNQFVHTKEELLAVSDRFSFPVVLKIVSPDISHKSDAGGVIVDIKDKPGLGNAYDEIMNSVKKYMPAAKIDGVLICEQAPKGQEIIIGTMTDDIFGPSIMFGLGGIFVEILKDVTFRVCPIQKHEALDMMKEIKGYALLKGARGNEGIDMDALAGLISKVSMLAYENKNIKEIDLNPVRAYKDEVMVLDARIIRH